MEDCCLLDIWETAAKKFGDKIAFSDNKDLIKISYTEALKQIYFFADKFKKWGIQKGDKISLFAVNSPYWLIIEQAIITSGAISVAKTSELNKMELEHIFNDSDSTALIIDNKEVLYHFINTNKDLWHKIKFVIFIGEKITNFEINSSKLLYFSDILNELETSSNIKNTFTENKDDLAYINYTSGTSSTPKGVLLTNNNMFYVVKELTNLYKLEEDKIYVDTFPLSSTGGKAFNYLCIKKGCKIIYTPYKEFYEVLDIYNPDYLLCAPKIIQTIYFKLKEETKKRNILFSTFFDLAYSISNIIFNIEHSFLYKQHLIFCSKLLNSIKNMLYKIFYKPIKNKLLKDDVTVFVGSAHLAKRFETFLHIMKIDLVQNYGLTEMSGIQFSNTIQSQYENPYTVGKVLPSTQVEIINPDTKEILKENEVGLIILKGPAQMKGYYKKEETTKKITLENGFLNTGDLGYIDKNGYLTVLSRYDDVIVMSNGYNVYIPLLENEAKTSDFIHQLVIVGHGKPYLSVLVVLNEKFYKDWCTRNKFSKQTNPNKCKQFKEFFLNDINTKIKKKSQYKYYEKIKKVFFIKQKFTVENGLLTGTLKTKYRRICDLYSKKIDEFYGDNE